jgi:ketosteroid isomerase-like protein
MTSKMQPLLLIPLFSMTMGLAQQGSGVKPDDESLQKQIVAQEAQGLDYLKTGDLKAFADSTSEDAVFVDGHGPATKALVVEHTAQFRLTEYSMQDVRFVRVSTESGLIVYTLTEKGTSHGKDFSARVYVSSLWAKRGGKWACLFSQETAAR